MRSCEIIIAKDKLNVDIKEICEKYRSIKKWAFILHDKDSNIKPHYHIVLSFIRDIDEKTLIKWFQLPVRYNFGIYIKDYFLDDLYIGNKFITTMRYLKHGQYNHSELITNFA